jgi:hypothetical protein
MNRAFFAVVVLALSVNGCDAFEDPVEAAPCNDIPEGGCPAPADSDGGVIENCKADPTCSALYACQPTGGWSLLVECPARPREAGVADARADARRDASELRDVAFDVPQGASGGQGCVDLEAPDCPLSLGLACPADSCCCCQDLYVCEDGGWNLWGYCADGGAIVQSSEK